MTGLIGVIVVILDIVAIVDLLKGPKDVTKKILWALFILLAPILGMILYFLLARPKTK